MIEKSNFKKNIEVELEKGLLNGQGAGNLATCRYGFFPMSYNGCEIIAVYNLRCLMGIPVPLPDVAKEIYPYGNAFSGLFGTWPGALERYFKENNLPVHKIDDYYAFRNEFEHHKFAVISFWNANHIFKGLHTVAIENFSGGIKVYNRSNKCTYPVEYKSLDYYMDAHRFICGYYAE
ncbi:MAG: hypothetical protein IJJ61_07880 [Clostridia bacterium]|nr:hypothetical protein [Clostridia bacterium]MBR5772783.1 hypothetical protein [Clostridia bacterium]